MEIDTFVDWSIKGSEKLGQPVPVMLTRSSHCFLVPSHPLVFFSLSQVHSWGRNCHSVLHKTSFNLFLRQRRIFLYHCLLELGEFRMSWRGVFPTSIGNKIHYICQICPFFATTNFWLEQVAASSLYPQSSCGLCLCSLPVQRGSCPQLAPMALLA